MFKKLKDKLAEEVKSSPQRFQQFAQAAQAAVTSASSSISDITKDDLFSIGDNDSQNSGSTKSREPAVTQQNTFQDVSFEQPFSSQLNTSSESAELGFGQDTMDKEKLPERQRRLSNSSFASDVSFRLPSYESPSMYHLQSDMEISASEAEERSFNSSSISLDRVTKEQLYAAYKRTQERYSKYRTQYADLARHYKLIERENTKARSVLVETQDKALRRISELKEQCALEQSAKAHLEKALRIDIEEKNMKIESLNTKIQLLQSDSESNAGNSINNNLEKQEQIESDSCLINLNDENDKKTNNIDIPSEVSILNDKIEKMEQLLNKYKESLKSIKEKNAQMITELQIVSNELDNKRKENEELKKSISDFEKVKDEMKQLNDTNEELQNKLNTYDFAKTKEFSTLEVDLTKAQEEILELRKKIEVFSKREEENAISLAENKLRIHKELESKETEIKSLKESLVNTTKEVQSLNIVINDYKNSITVAEEENNKLKKEVAENNSFKFKINDFEAKIKDMSQKYQNAEHHKAKLEEECKCLQLQIQQENAEKLALKDRNDYLEKRNTQLSDENAKKSSQINNIEKELQDIKKETLNSEAAQAHDTNVMSRLEQEVSVWKCKYEKLESEIQEEREELVKLQLEIEKLMTNHELTQKKNSELLLSLSKYESENSLLIEEVSTFRNIKSVLPKILHQTKYLRNNITTMSNEIQTFKNIFEDTVPSVNVKLYSLSNVSLDNAEINKIKESYNELMIKLHESESKAQKITERSNETDKALKQLQDESTKLKSIISDRDLHIETLNAKFDEISKKLQINEENFSSLEKENSGLIEKIKEIETKHTVLHDENTKLKSENLKLESNIAKINTNDVSSNQKLKEITEKLQINIDKCNNLEKEKLDLLARIDVTENKYNILQEDLKKQKLDIAEKESQNKTSNVEFNKISEELKIKIEKCNNLEQEKSSLKEEMNEIEAKYTILQDILNKQRKEHQVATDSVKELENKNNELTDTLQEIKIQNSNLTLELQHFTSQIKTNADQIQTLKNDKELLQSQLTGLEDKKQHVIKLEENIKILMEENKSLKDQSKQITESMEKLESELNVIKRSHLEIESEKDRLNDIIKELEKREEKSLEEKVDLSNYISKSEYDTIKEENRRLQSDIEGLQTYLTKISKENGVLNDKLRESIAFTEISNDNDPKLIELQNEVEIGKEKLNDLLRENSLLIEENLELKDQLNIQNANAVSETKKLNYETNNSNKNDDHLKEKYSDLLISKNKLEQKLANLEQMNSTVNLNMQQLQVNNEKLRLSNDKLERRLDEALVSLHHLHSMQENTELEYLRNILYEYLTGSGTHSITLAKVLAAVVKFDDEQTKTVLQKERERQGLLHQLGIVKP